MPDNISEEIIKVNVKYEAGHNIDYEYSLTELFCPICGNKTVYVDQGYGDYYLGPDHLCITCNSTFAGNINEGQQDDDELKESYQISSQIKEFINLQ